MTSLLRLSAEESAVPSCVLSVIGSLGCAGFLLDRNGRVLFFNEMARCHIGDGLALRGDRLAATDRESDARLRNLIEVALASTESPHTTISIGLRRICKRPLLVRILRLEETARPALSSATLLIVTLDPEICPEPPRETLQQVFALTPTEAKVANGIICGKTLAEIACDLGVKIGTVRAHLKAVFCKTQTRGQAQLTGLLTRLAFVTAWFS